MLFWIFVIMLVAGIVLLVLDEFGDLCDLYVCMSVIGGLVSAIMLVCIIFAHVGVEGDIAACNARYESLVYQYENDLYDNDNDLGKKELMDDIQDWNEDLSRNRENQDNFWIGIFYPNIYDQFELIPLDKK